MTEMKCRKCEKEATYLQNGLCNGCINRVSFMDYWQLETPEEAVKLYIIQDLNKSIYHGDEKLRERMKKEGLIDEQGLVCKVPEGLEKMLKECEAWSKLIMGVQSVKDFEEITCEG
ncbi:hypothetical protein [Candidatus Lokiarchaeum ossiferum]|uniref:hypothetical protein n=1 Tax=Candidatus Lokiarchaeum ossiferum TaxID=2951803 RepID=UPI00352D28C7